MPYCFQPIALQDRFIRFPQCICTVGHTGSHCESIIDPCIDYPCYVGVECNNSNINGNLTAVCGPCPSGLVGDGRKCYGMYYPDIDN